MNWHIDYLTITITGGEVEKQFNTFFNNMFSRLVDQGHGGKFYKVLFRSDLGIQVRSCPINSEIPRSTIVFPGQACQLMGFYVIKMFIEMMEYLYPGNVVFNRFDLAFDDCNFSIEQVEKALLFDDLRSYFKRETIRFYNNPYELQDDGQVGTRGVTVGGRSSTRYMRIYNKHGFTRLEVEFKHEKAGQVARDVIGQDNPDLALRYAIGHIRDYVDFFEDWWNVFVCNQDRLFKKLPGTVQSMTSDRIKRWFEKQIASAFFILTSLEGGEYLDNLYNIGKEKYEYSKYKGLLEIGAKNTI
jgi:DNA relaxase NicK